MNASVLCDIVPRAKIEGTYFYLMREALHVYPIGHERSLSNRLRTWSLSM